MIGIRNTVYSPLLNTGAKLDILWCLRIPALHCNKGKGISGLAGLGCCCKFSDNLPFSSSRLHLSSYSVIGSVKKSVLMTIQDIYFNAVCYFEQVLYSKFPENLSFSSSRLNLSSCSVIGSLEDRSVLMTIQDNYFNTVCYFEQVLLSKFHRNLSFSCTAPVLLLCNLICWGQECLYDHPWHLFQ